MWKRLHREKDRTIGKPTLIDTTYDENALYRIPNASEVNESGHTPTGLVGNISPEASQ
jgi:hypothetical protein